MELDPRSLLCLSRLEFEVGELYTYLAEAVDRPLYSMVLGFIGADSAKHGEAFRRLALGLDAGTPEPGMSECRELLGSMYSESMELVKRLKERAQGAGLEEVAGILEELAGFEDVVGEEYLTSIASALYFGASDRGGVDGLASIVVRYIVEDEERHVKLVKALLRRIRSG